MRDVKFEIGYIFIIIFIIQFYTIEETRVFL